MNPRIILPGIVALFFVLLLPTTLSAQIGNIIISTGAEITIPTGAVLCADTIFANNPGYGTITYPNVNSICRAVVIPVELIRFSASQVHGSVLLAWSTVAETNSYGFEVQRKTENSDWSALGFNPGHGSTSEQHSYGFTDDLEDLPAYCCELRYRLKQIDLDGQYEYSPEVELLLNQPLPRFALEGYPSPCDDALTVRLTLGEAGVTNIRLHDIAGRMVKIIAQDAILPAGSHSMRVRTAEVPSGLYLIVVENREGQRSEKVLIRH